MRGIVDPKVDPDDEKVESGYTTQGAKDDPIVVA